MDAPWTPYPDCRITTVDVKPLCEEGWSHTFRVIGTHLHVGVAETERVAADPMMVVENVDPNARPRRMLIAHSCSFRKAA